MKSAKIKLPVVMMFVLVLTSCTYKVPFMVQSNSLFDIPKDEYDVKVMSQTEVEGRATLTSFIGITQGDAGIIAAQKDALKKTDKANALINMKVDTEVHNFLYIYTSYTTIVRGFPVKVISLKAKAALEEKVQAAVKAASIKSEVKQEPAAQQLAAKQPAGQQPVVQQQVGNKKSIISGIVTDNEKTPLAGAVVKILKDDNEILVVNIPENGMFRIQNVVPGNYVLEFGCKWYNGIRKQVVVDNTGKPVELNIALEMMR